MTKRRVVTALVVLGTLALAAVATAGPPPDTPPTLTVPGSITQEATSAAGATVSYSVTADDAEDDPDPTPDCGVWGLTGDDFPLGVTTVNCSVTDSASQTASDSFTVTVQDTTAPTLGNVPADISVPDTGSPGEIVTWTDPTATDTVDSDPTVSCAPSSGSSFSVGATTVTCTATDDAGNQASEGFTVTVTDGEAPVIDVPGIWISEANGPTGSVVNYVLPAVSDNDDPSPALTCDPPPGELFPLGTTTVTCTATDADDNTSQATFPVLVQDTTPPVVTPPADLTIQSASPVLLTDPRVQQFLTGATATDIVDTSVAITTDAPDPLPVGTTTVTFTATDDAGNSTEATAAITVTSSPIGPPPDTDTTPPGNVRSVRGIAGNLSVAITWRPPADRDFDHVRITRSPGAGGADSSQVYRGKATRFVARNLSAGVEYRFVIVAFDDDGNRSAGVAVVALAGRHPLLSPANGSAIATPLRLAWRPVKGADYYNVQFWHKGRKKQSVWPRGTTYTLPRQWSYAGRPRTLAPGEWRVFVWPGFGPRSQNNYGKVHVRAIFVVVRNR